MLTPSAALAGLRWLLEVEHVGQTYRWTSDGASVTSDDGDLPALGGLDTRSLHQSIRFGEPEAQRLSVSLSLHWPTDHAQEAVYGLDLTAAQATLYVLGQDQQREDAQVVVAGRLSEPVYGGVGEPLSTTLSGDPLDDSATIPDPDARIGPGTWPNAPEQSFGQWYPIVWGRPGVVDGGAKVEGSPAYAIATTTGSVDTLLIAGHKVRASTVDVLIDSGNGILASYTATVSHASDGLGRRVATADISGAGAAFRTAGAWSIQWTSAAMSSPYAPGRSVSTLGEIARWLADQSSVPQDRAAWAAFAQAFPWSAAGWISAPASPMEVLRDQVLPALPVALVWGRGGMKPVRIPYDAGPDDALEHLIAGQDCSRLEGVVYDRRSHELTQEIRVGFGGDDLRRWVTVRADGVTSDPDDTSCVWSRAARMRWRANVLQSREILSPVVWRRSTATQVGLWAARLFGASPRRLSYAVGPYRAWLELGDVVLLTDDELHESETVCVVVGREVSVAASVRLELVALPGWTTQARNKPSGGSSDTPVFPPGT